VAEVVPGEARDVRTSQRRSEDAVDEVLRVERRPAGVAREHPGRPQPRGESAENAPQLLVHRDMVVHAPFGLCALFDGDVERPAEERQLAIDRWDFAARPAGTLFPLSLRGSVA